MKRGPKIVIGIATLVVLLVAVYFTFFFYYRCDDLGCYRGHQEKCARTKFLNEDADALWQYRIDGKKSGQCVVNVEIVRLKEGTIDKSVLEGKSMNCYLELESIVNPEQDLSLCHGALKEEMQNLIIQKLHKYVLENVGNISSELNKAV